MVLSRFELLQIVARGGMGVVWKARHLDSGEVVAVKVLSTEGASAERLVHALHAEVAAMAGLRHPHIVYVFDYGSVPTDWNDPSHEVAPGSPWFAMEFVDGTTLSKRKWTHDWTSLKSVLLDLLDALAHAHARGVIHRDLKPSNVLMSGKPGRSRLKLTDFGLAFAFEAYFERSGGQPQLAGTPTYMAPEQVASDPSLQGPWTDLYNLGCIAWSLACGGRPYRHRDPQKLIEAHQFAPVPELRPRMPLPKGFDEWVYKLMAKRTRERFHRAADAAWALVQLDRQTPQLTRDIQASMLHTLVFEEASASSTGTVGEHPPLPRSWRRRQADPIRIVGAGAGLFALRSFPLEGRHTEREGLWRALAEVHRTRRPQGVVLSGPTGIGKSRLVEWLSRRSHEVGGASIYRATHTEDGSPTEGLMGLLGRALQTTRVRLDQLEAHIAEVVDRHQGPQRAAAALARVLSGRGGDDGSEHHVLVEETIGWHADGRTAIICIDDAHLGEDALRFVHAVLRRRTLPALIVLTVRDEALPDRPRERELLDTLPSGKLLRVGPLPRPDMERVVDGLLQLEPALRAQVVERASGNPSFAVQLVKDWVERGILDYTASGFVLPGDATAHIPTTFSQIWARRVDELLTGHEDWRLPLEIAATLGVAVISTEWDAACKAAGIHAPRALVLALLRHSLALVEEGTMGHQWHFAHGMLREAVLVRAWEEGRMPSLHMACASALARDPQWIDRYGRHLLEADRRDDAIDALVQGAIFAVQRGAFSRSVHAASLAERAMPAADPRARIALEVRIRAAQLRGETEEARLHIRRLVQWAKLRRDHEASAVATRASAELHLRTGHADEAIATAQEAVTLSTNMSPRARAEACCTLGFAHALAWDFRHAEAAFRDAAGHDNHFHPAAWGLGRIRLDLEHAHAALPFLERAAQLAHKEGDRIRIAKFGATLAHTQRVLGNLEKSLALAEAAYRSLDSCGADGASEARTQVALTLLAQGRHKEARELLEEELALVAQRDDLAVVRLASGAHWAACGAGSDWDRAADLTPIAGDGLALSRATELELVRLLHRFGERAFHAGQLVLARDAWTPARVIYRRLGMPQDSAQLTHTLRGLPSSSTRARPSDTSHITPTPGRRLTRRKRDPS